MVGNRSLDLTILMRRICWEWQYALHILLYQHSNSTCLGRVFVYFKDRIIKCLVGISGELCGERLTLDCGNPDNDFEFGWDRIIFPYIKLPFYTQIGSCSKQSELNYKQGPLEGRIVLRIEISKHSLPESLLEKYDVYGLFYSTLNPARHNPNRKVSLPYQTGNFVVLLLTE